MPNWKTRRAHCPRFPYRHLEYAQLENEAGTFSAKLCFTSHFVRICGRNLLDLISEFQNRSVASINSLPEHFAALLPKEAVLIERIEVEDLNQHEE
jgi:hypothetical protein